MCKAFTLQGELTSTKVNLTESIRRLTRRYKWVLLLKESKMMGYIQASPEGDAKQPNKP